MTSSVQVLYALPDEQVIVDVAFVQGMTVADAVAESGLTERFPAIESETLVAGVWGRPVSNSQLLQVGDRVEISRPLKADPRTMRRDYLAHGQVMGGGSLENETKKPGP